MKKIIYNNEKEIKNEKQKKIIRVYPIRWQFVTAKSKNAVHAKLEQKRDANAA